MSQDPKTDYKTKKPKTNSDNPSQLMSAFVPPCDLGAEQSLLGSILLNSKLLDNVSDKLRPEFFYDPRHQEIFLAMMRLWTQNTPCDLIFVMNQMDSFAKKQNRELTISQDYLLELISKSSLASSTDGLVSILKNKFLLRTLVGVGDDLKNLANNESETPQEILDQAQKKLYEVSLDSIDKNFVSINEILLGSFDRLAELQSNGKEFSGCPTGFADLDRVLGGMHNSDLIILAARPAMGKAQPGSSLIKTIDGWTVMSQIKVGDEIASTDGQKSIVEGVYPQGIKPTYKITFADGRSSICCGEHLWQVNNRAWSTPRVLSTLELQHKLSIARYKNRIWIPVCNGQFGSQSALSVDPYLLGCLIGDGCLVKSTPMISSKDSHILDKIRNILPNDLHLVHSNKYDYRISQKTRTTSQNFLTKALIDLGIMGKMSNQKFIPQDYLLSAKENRLQLLRGLLDTDGWVESTGSVRFCTVSSDLAKDVQELVRSLGGYCAIKTKKTTFTYNNLKKEGQLAFVLNICGLDDLEIFTLPHKLDRCTQKTKTKRLNIISIEELEPQECFCIKVSHPSSLYITDNYVVTHNTSLVLELAKRVALVEQVGVAIFSLEMSKEQLVDKMLSSVSGVDNWKIRTGKFDDNGDNNEFQKIGEAIGLMDQAPIWIDDSGSLNVLELRSKARRLKTRHNIGLLIIDYLQLMGGTGRNYGNNRVQEVSDISRGLKILAKELEIPVIALSQLSRSVEGRDDKRPMLSDLRESGSIEQDADVVMFVHREEMYHKETKRKGIADILIAKHRHGSTATVELAWVARLATFDNLDNAKKTYRVNE